MRLEEGQGTRRDVPEVMTSIRETLDGLNRAPALAVTGVKL
jgi:hypothetical protein